jgi:hypothetical protein
MVSIRLGSIVRVSNVQEALEHAFGIGEKPLVDSIGSCQIVKGRTKIDRCTTYRKSKGH